MLDRIYNAKICDFGLTQPEIPEITGDPCDQLVLAVVLAYPWVMLMVMLSSFKLLLSVVHVIKTTSFEPCVNEHAWPLSDGPKQLQANSHWGSHQCTSHRGSLIAALPAQHGAGRPLHQVDGKDAHHLEGGWQWRFPALHGVRTANLLRHSGRDGRVREDTWECVGGAKGLIV